MYNLHKIILLYINEMFKLKINNSKPKDWPEIPLWIHDTRCEAKLISAKFVMLGDDLSVVDFLSSMTFPWLLMIFQSSMTFHNFSRKLYFSRFSRPCGNPGACVWICFNSCVSENYTSLITITSPRGKWDKETNMYGTGSFNSPLTHWGRVTHISASVN